MGLEPTHSHLRQILSLMRLPFRHSCAFNSDILAQTPEKCKQNIASHNFVKNFTITYCTLQKPCYNEWQVNNSEVESYASSVRGWGVVTERKAERGLRCLIRTRCYI